MLINIAKFAKLFDNKVFLRWMRANAPTELKEVKDAEGSAFQPAVINAYNKLYNSPIKEKFQKLIGDKFSEIISQEELPISARLMVQAGEDPNKVFSHYNPQLLRLPMQIMFESDNIRQLEKAVNSFVVRLRSERSQMIVGNRAYVEYVPSHLSKHNIPESNWEIKSWKAKNKVR